MTSSTPLEPTQRPSTQCPYSLSTNKAHESFIGKGTHFFGDFTICFCKTLHKLTTLNPCFQICEVAIRTSAYWKKGIFADGSTHSNYFINVNYIMVSEAVQYEIESLFWHPNNQLTLDKLQVPCVCMCISLKHTYILSMQCNRGITPLYLRNLFSSAEV